MNFTCCGNSVQKGAKIIAIFQMVTVSAIILLVCAAVIFDSIQFSSLSTSDTFVMVLLVLLAGSIQFLISYTLYKGAVKPSVCRLNIWLVFNFFGIILTVYNLASGGRSVETPELLAQIFSLGVEFWFVAVVYELRAQILNNKLPVVVYSQPKDQMGLTAVNVEA